MGLHVIVLLASALLVCISNNAVATSVPDFTTKVRQNHNSVPIETMVRFYETKGANVEERGGIDYISKLIQSGASKIESARLKAAMFGGNNRVRALNMLQLGDNVRSALTNTKLKTLEKFIAKFNTKNPEKKITLIETLSARYGDDAVIRTLVSLQRDPKVSPELATKARELQTEQLNVWLMKDKSVIDVFNLLKLSDDGIKVLFSRIMEVFEDYITRFNRKNAKDETLLKTLTTSLGDESKLLSFLAKAKDNMLSAEKARGLENELINKWRSENLGLGRVWKLHDMGTNLDDILINDKLQIFYKFVSRYNKYNPNSDMSVVAMLTAKYGEVAVAKALVRAKENPVTKWFVTKLQMEQLRGWMERKMSADDVFALLKIKSEGTLSMMNHNLAPLDEYVKLFNANNPSKNTDMLTVLRGGFGEDKFAILLVRASENPSSKSIASKYQELLFADWVKREINPVNVFSDVFKVPEDKLASLSVEAKRTITLYKHFFNGAVIHEPIFVRPGRS